MESNIDTFVRATKSTAKTLKCGFFLFAAEAHMPSGETACVAHNIAGGMMLHALRNAANFNCKEMLKSGMSEKVARSLIMSYVEHGIREANHADEA